MSGEKGKRILRNIGKTLGFLTLCGVLTALFCGIAFLIYANTEPGLNVDEFENMARAQDRNTKLYYMNYTDSVTRTGVAKELENETLFADQNREWIKYGNIPEELVNAFVSIEDHRFFEHNGIDIKRTAGAVLGYVTGRSGYGGSTITQQLIKNVTGDDEYSVSRKVKEMIRAYRLDKLLTKEEIMELYLNTIYLSHKSYGVGSAAQTYFGKDVSELTLSECAALACIPQSPTKWDPIYHPENNASRRSLVLTRMAELGMISEEERDRAIAEPLNLSEDHEDGRVSDKVYSWYTESVISESIRLLTENKIAANEQTAAKLLYTGGLSIITAQNPKMQAEVEAYFSVASNFYKTTKGTHPECSIVVIDPKTGDILALAGATGSKTKNRTLNYATSTTRSPGSSIKPLSVYAPALDKGYITYGTVFDDVPVDFIDNGSGKYREWPHNSPGIYRGLTTIREGVAQSVNTIAVQVLDRVGKEESFNVLHNKLNLKHVVSSLKKNGKTYTDMTSSALALGQMTNGVTVAEITAGYTSLCNNGIFHEGRTVLKILDASGKVLVDNTGEGRQVFTPQTAAIMTKLLQGVTKSGTASSVTLKNTVECAGKTGTTSSNCDKWFIGYTPDLLAGVWFGYPESKSLSGYTSGVSPAIKTWDNVMKRINTEECLGFTPNEKFPECEGIVTATYCKDSGKLMSAACAMDPRGNRAETGYFAVGTAPTEYCNCHVLVDYDIVNHGVACPDCPRENVKKVGLLNVKRVFPQDVTVRDAQYTWQRLSDGIQPCLLSGEPFYLGVIPRGSSPGHSATASPFNRYCYICKLREHDEEQEDEGYEDDFTTPAPGVTDDIPLTPPPVIPQPAEDDGDEYEG